MGYAKEFNAADYVIPSFLQTAYWHDVSWHNDIAPRFENYELLLAVWVETADQADREYADWKQYTVVKIRDISGGTTLEDESSFETDNADELHEWLHKYAVKEDLLKAFATASLYSCTHDIADELAELLTHL